MPTFIMLIFTDGETVMYIFTCIRCGKERKVVGKKGICDCGLQYELEWPAKVMPSKPEKSITDKLEKE